MTYVKGGLGFASLRRVIVGPLQPILKRNDSGEPDDPSVGPPIPDVLRPAPQRALEVFRRWQTPKLAQIADLVPKGVIKPVVDRIFPISECQSAVEYSASGRARGKIVISVID